MGEPAEDRRAAQGGRLRAGWKIARLAPHRGRLVTGQTGILTNWQAKRGAGDWVLD